MAEAISSRLWPELLKVMLMTGAGAGVRKDASGIAQPAGAAGVFGTPAARDSASAPSGAVHVV